MVAVGGVGGSGTRVIAQILEKIGFFIGRDLNESYDNLLFTLLFKRENILTLLDDDFDTVVSIFLKVMNSDKKLTSVELKTVNELAQNDRTLHSSKWLQERLRFIQNNTEHKLWGWKEPNTHIIIEKLLLKMDNLKFIYVYRNGLDMAYSTNQNQLKLWGSIFFNEKNIAINPENSLRYWCIIHKRMLKLQKVYTNKILMLDFDQLCEKPYDSLRNILDFIQMPYSKIETLVKMIKAPSSIGRYKNYPLASFREEDLIYINQIYHNDGG